MICGGRRRIECWVGTVRRVVQCSAVRCFTGRICWRGGCAVAVAVAQRGRVCVSEDQCLSLPPFPLCPALLSACFFFCFVLFCFAWTLCNLQMYDAGGYPVEAAVPDIGYSALAALPTLPSNLDCSTTHARSLMDLARSRLEIAVMRQS
jgi:hypothetical protein